MALTQKQELFCQNVVSGMSYKDAYINAYDTKAKDSTIRTESARLALQEDIQARIKALSKPMQEAAQIQGINAKEKQLKEIDDRIAICKEKDDEQSIIRYMDMRNKLMGWYSTADEQQEKKNDMLSLDTEMLKKITCIG